MTYDNLNELDIVNGFARYIGSHKPLDRLGRKLKRQNPQPLKAKVKNYAQMHAELATLDPFMLSHTPNFEPQRGPSVPHFVAAKKKAPLLFMPIPSGPTESILKWMAELDSVQKKGFTAELFAELSSTMEKSISNTQVLHGSQASSCPCVSSIL